MEYAIDLGHDVAANSRQPSTVMGDFDLESGDKLLGCVVHASSELKSTRRGSPGFRGESHSDIDERRLKISEASSD